MSEAAPQPILPVCICEDRHSETAAELLSTGYEIVPLGKANGQLTGRSLLVWLSDPAAELDRVTALCKAASTAKLLRFPKGDMPPQFAGLSLTEFAPLAKPHARVWDGALEVELLKEKSERIVRDGQAETARYLAESEERDRIARIRNAPVESLENTPEIGPETDPSDEPADDHDDAADIALASVLEAERHSVVFSVEHDPDVWQTPHDLWGGAHLPDVELDHGPAAIMTYLLDQAALAGVDPVQPLVNGITVCAGLVNETIALQMMAESTRWAEKARLWGAVVGDPSTRKGAGLDIVTADFYRIAKKLRDSQESELSEYEEQVKLHECRMREWRPIEAKTPGTKPRPVPPEKPSSDRLWTDDATKEKVAHMLSKHSRGKIMVVKDELAAWFGSFDAYSAGKGEKDKPDWLSAYEGKERYIDRVGEGRSIHVPSWSVQVLGGIQPSVLAGIATKLLGGDGMLQRFQIVVSKPAGEGEERKPDQRAADRWQRVLNNLLGLLYAEEQGPIRLSPDAQAFRSECSRWLNKAMRSGLSPQIVAALGKWEGLLGRLTLTFHCIDAADNSRPFPDRLVPVQTIERAWRYMTEILWPHALHFYDGVLAESDTKSPLRWVAGLILVQGLREVSTTYLSRHWSGYRALKTPAQRKELFDGLVTAGWLRPVGGSDIAGKMPTRYLVNPSVLDGRFTEQRAAYEAERTRYTEIMRDKMPNKFRREAGED